MSRAKQLTDEERAAVVQGWAAGRKQAELSEQFGVSQSAIFQLLSSIKKRRTVKRAKAPGNPRKTMKKLDRMILRNSRDNPRKTDHCSLLYILLVKLSPAGKWRAEKAMQTCGCLELFKNES